MTRGTSQAFYLPTDSPAEAGMGPLFLGNDVNNPFDHASLQTVNGTQPRQFNEMDMILGNDFDNSPDVWPENALPNGFQHPIDDHGTLKMEDVEAAGFAPAPVPAPVAHLAPAPAPVPAPTAQSVSIAPSVPVTQPAPAAQSAPAPAPAAKPAAGKPPPPPLPIRNRRTTKTNATGGRAQIAHAAAAQGAQPVAEPAQAAPTDQQSGKGQTAAPRKKRPARNKAYTSPEDMEKRQRFLERNRMAAFKCRKRRKEEIEGLQLLHKNLQQSHENMRQDISALSTGLSELVSLAMSHRGCRDQRIAEWLARYQSAEQMRLVCQHQEEARELAEQAAQMGSQMSRNRSQNRSQGSQGGAAMPAGHQQHMSEAHQQMQPMHHLHQQPPMTMPVTMMAQPEPMASTAMPMAPTLFTHNPFATTNVGTAGPVPENLFSMSPAATSPPALVNSNHKRQLSSATDSSAYARRADSNYTSASSATSVTDTPNMPEVHDFPNFVDAKPCLAPTDDGEMFHNLFIMDSPAGTV